MHACMHACIHTCTCACIHIYRKKGYSVILKPANMLKYLDNIM